MDNKIVEEINNNIYIGDRLECLKKIESNSVSLIFTSPPYNLKKEYLNHNDDLIYSKYLMFLFETWKECFRVLRNGGRIVINVSSITQGNSNYKFLYSHIIHQLETLNLIPRGEIIWYKQNISNRTAWGSWKSPSNPYLVQPYEFLIIFSKNTKKLEGNQQNIDITKDEFIEYTNSLWKIRPETKKKNHPAPFPEELAKRVIKFYTYKNDIVLDPFAGTGTTPYIAWKLNRIGIYIDNCKDYSNIYRERFNNG